MDLDATENMEIDALCYDLDSIKLVNSLNINLVNDLNIIIREIANGATLDVDIYTICVSCGNNIVWDQEYQISQEDIIWLSNKGKTFFFESMNSFIRIDTPEKYHKAMKIYNDIFELFSKAA